MKKIFAYFLFIVLAIVSSSQFLFAQDCDKKIRDCEDRIRKSIASNDSLRNQINANKIAYEKRLAEEEVAYDTLDKRYMREQKRRISLEKKLAEATITIGNLQVQLTTKTAKINELTTEQNQLREKIKQMEGENEIKSKAYNDVLEKLNAKNLEISKLDSEKTFYKTAFEDSQKLVKSLTNRKNILEDEENDKISMQDPDSKGKRKGRIYFKGQKYDFEQEIFLIKAKHKTSYELIIDDEVKATLRRFAKLIHRYDVKVKISLKGQSLDEGRKDRNDFAEGRAKKLIDYLLNQFENEDNPEHKFNKEQFWDNKLILKETVPESQIGVSVRIIKK